MSDDEQWFDAARRNYVKAIHDGITGSALDELEEEYEEAKRFRAMSLKSDNAPSDVLAPNTPCSSEFSLNPSPPAPVEAGDNKALEEKSLEEKEA